jgi:CRISPR-associated protein Cmr5
MGSLKSAIAYFSAQGGAQVERQKLMNAIYYLIEEKDPPGGSGNRALFDYVVKNNNYRAKEEVINAAIALKCAMNLYILEDA